MYFVLANLKNQTLTYVRRNKILLYFCLGMGNANLIRINKYLSEIGFCSRREADKLISQGSVKINGCIALMGAKISIDDEVSVHGKPISKRKKKLYIYCI